MSLQSSFFFSIFLSNFLLIHNKLTLYSCFLFSFLFLMHLVHLFSLRYLPKSVLEIRISNHGGGGGGGGVMRDWRETAIFTGSKISF